MINGKEYDWIFDAKNRLISEASAPNDLLQTDLSGDFRSVDGILFPFSNKSQLGSLTSDLKLTSVEVNPNLTGKDWAIPQ